MEQYLDLFHPDLLYELRMWSDIKDEMDYPENDNNNGLIYGIYWLDDNREVVEVEWFKTDKERKAEVKLTQDRLLEAFPYEYK